MRLSKRVPINYRQFTITTPTNKTQLRRQLLQQRQSLTTAEWQEKSIQICHLLSNWSLFKSAKTIVAYFSFRKEPDLSYLFSFERTWGFSHCVGKSLSWHSWSLDRPLQTNSYGILEPLPVAPILQPEEVDLIIVPAVACDELGYRLGYGGGYYDRTLSSPLWAAKRTIGVVFDFAFLPQLPIDEWDRKLHGICTEKKLTLLQ